MPYLRYYYRMIWILPSIAHSYFLFFFFNIHIFVRVCHVITNITVVSPILINGAPVEQVDSFKYLGVMLDKQMSFTEHVTAVQNKSHQRLHVLRKLRAFYVDPLLLLRLYRSIIEPLITYCSIYYYPALSVKNRNRLLKFYTNALRNNRPCNFEESSCCRYWVWSSALCVLPYTSVSKEIPLYKM